MVKDGAMAKESMDCSLVWLDSLLSVVALLALEAALAPVVNIST